MQKQRRGFYRLGSIYNIKRIFVDWTKKKIIHHINNNHKNVYFREREVWWAALGKNIGYEIDGKHDYFSRPVVIVKKYSRDMCFVVPLTTKIRDDNPQYQYILHLQGKRNAINLSQGRTISNRRLMQKKCNIDLEVFEDIIKKYVNLLIG